MHVHHGQLNTDKLRSIDSCIQLHHGQLNTDTLWTRKYVHIMD